MLELAFAVYILISAIVLGILHRRSFRSWLLRMIVVAAFPIVGWLFPLFWGRHVHDQSDDQFEQYIMDQHEEQRLHHIGVYAEPEAEKELSVIPLEEALLISGHNTRRRAMIDVLKEDAVHHLEILQTAVSNEDTETSHYAVSAIMEVKRKLLIAIQDLSVQYEQDKNNEHLASTYAEVLANYLRSGFLDQRTYVKYQYTYLEVLETLIKISEDAKGYYTQKTDIELELALFAVAVSTSSQFLERYPLAEEAYLCHMKVSYAMKSGSQLQETLQRLKQAPIKLSNHALTMVRFWSEGV